MSRETWCLEFYRTSQAGSYAEAKEDGSLRVYELDDEPRLPLEEADPFNYGPLADLVILINQACDMMEHEAKINHYLTCNGEIVAKEEWPAENIDGVVANTGSSFNTPPAVVAQVELKQSDRSDLARRLMHLEELVAGMRYDNDNTACARCGMIP